MTTSAYFDECKTSTKQYTNLRLHSKSTLSVHSIQSFVSHKIHVHENLLPSSLFHLLSNETQDYRAGTAIRRNTGHWKRHALLLQLPWERAIIIAPVGGVISYKNFIDGKRDYDKKCGLVDTGETADKPASYLWSSQENCKIPGDPRSLSESERRIKPVAHSVLVLRNKFRRFRSCFLKVTESRLLYSPTVEILPPEFKNWWHVNTQRVICHE